MKINHNLSAVITNTELKKSENSVAESMEKLSSGFSINHSKDSPVGMAISNMMKTQIKGLDRATENAQSFVSLLNTAEGAMSEMHSVAQRMRELAVQAANDTNTSVDREALENEMKAMREEIDRIGKDSEFNGINLLDGTMDLEKESMTTEEKLAIKEHAAQIGAEVDQQLTIEIEELNSITLGISELKLDSFENAGDAIEKMDVAIQRISEERSHVGSLVNRLEFTVAYLEDNSENMNAAVSTIADTDMAEEMTRYTSKNVLVQSATSMLAQANDQPEQLLQLLQ